MLSKRLAFTWRSWLIADFNSRILVVSWDVGMHSTMAMKSISAPLSLMRMATATAPRTATRTKEIAPRSVSEADSYLMYLFWLDWSCVTMACLPSMGESSMILGKVL